ncbi:hypothetical protein B0H13DRAFT_1882891 [Mycena leptocephala]|nr:hypothetical protein B0H13DRAFT_1882891 [Mycena leptocephala]
MVLRASSPASPFLAVGVGAGALGAASTLVEAFPAYGLGVSVATDGTLFQTEVFVVSHARMGGPLSLAAPRDMAGSGWRESDLLGDHQGIRARAGQLRVQSNIPSLVSAWDYKYQRHTSAVPFEALLIHTPPLPTNPMGYERVWVDRAGQTKTNLLAEVRKRL